MFFRFIKNMPYTFFSQIFEKFGEFIKNPQITDVWNVLKWKRNLDNSDKLVDIHDIFCMLPRSCRHFTLGKMSGEEVPTNMAKTSFTDQSVKETWCPWTWIRLLPTHCWSIYAAGEQQFLIITYIIFIYSSVSGSRANSFLNATLRKWLFKAYPG